MSEQKKLLRNIVKSDFPYKGRIVELRVDTVKFPSGAEKLREVVLHKAAVAMLPVDEDGKIILVRQYRHAIDEEIYEIPAGLVEEGEDGRETAVRELREEIGFRPGRMEKIAEFYTSPGFTTEKITLYYATELIASKLQEDDDEYLKVCKFSSREIEELIAENRIIDGKTLMAYYWYLARKAEK
ncbi:MAG: NUDIX hydrolase [Synergistaceae bacterium]|nr:NUDIX hydrolase [Synergistaceae bacterium]